MLISTELRERDLFSAAVGYLVSYNGFLFPAQKGCSWFIIGTEGVFIRKTSS